MVSRKDRICADLGISPDDLAEMIDTAQAAMLQMDKPLSVAEASTLMGAASDALSSYWGRLVGATPAPVKIAAVDADELLACCDLCLAAVGSVQPAMRSNAVLAASLVANQLEQRYDALFAEGTR